MKINVNAHSSIRLNTEEKIIYIDPFNIEKNFNDADIIFFTHDHYDHFSKEDILKVINDNTVLVIPEISIFKTHDFHNEVISVTPNNTYNIKGISVETIPAYNIGKAFHPKENKWVGYILTLEKKRYYIAGDTDVTEENKQVKCDVAFVPVGGTYTMDYKEAAELINTIKPSIAIPIHYGSIVGTEEDGKNFSMLVNDNTKVNVIL